MRQTSTKLVWLFITVLLGFVAFLWMGPALMIIKEATSRFQQRGSHDKIYETIIQPVSTWIKSFQTNNLRLPTQEELDDYTSGHFPAVTIVIYTNAFSGESPWNQPGIDFILCAHVEDWNLNLQSWDGKRFKYWTD